MFKISWHLPIGGCESAATDSDRNEKTVLILIVQFALFKKSHHKNASEQLIQSNRSDRSRIGGHARDCRYEESISIPSTSVKSLCYKRLMLLN
jgi:hypothetical protein